MINHEKIDTYFQGLISLGSNFVGVGDFDFVEKEMTIEKDCPIEGCNYWQPIESTVSTSDIENLECEIGFKLPETYIDFLKYKHFYELRFYGCEFIPHPINSWRKMLVSEIVQDREIFLDKGYIVFAYHLPEGAFCFDANNDFSIVLWTPENPKIETDFEPNSFTKVFENFEEMMGKLNNDNLIIVDNNAS